MGKQMDKMNYGMCMPISCLTETCPDPTTEVVDMGLRLALASKQKMELVNIGPYSTTRARYVNDILQSLPAKFRALTFTSMISLILKMFKYPFG